MSWLRGGRKRLGSNEVIDFALVLRISRNAEGPPQAFLVRLAGQSK